MRKNEENTKKELFSKEGRASEVKSEWEEEKRREWRGKGDKKWDWNEEFVEE